LGLYFETLATFLIPLASFLLILLLIILFNIRDANGLKPTQLEFWRIVYAETQQPKVYQLMIWVMLFCYPSLARKSFSIFDCIGAGEDSEGATVFLLRTDPALRCYTDEWTAWAAVVGVLGLGFYCIGFPVAVLILTHRYQRSVQDDPSAYGRVAVLLSSYEDKYWYMETVSLFHRLFFTGAIHIIDSGTRLQIWSGVLASIVSVFLFILTFPFKHDICDFTQVAALLQLLLTYVSAFLYIDDGIDEVARYRTDAYGNLLIAINCTCFFVLLASAGKEIVDERRKLARRQLRYKDDHSIAPLRPLARGLQHHIFLSHVWRTGQDVSWTKHPAPPAHTLTSARNSGVSP
jgi:hypothetical protein